MDISSFDDFGNYKGSSISFEEDELVEIEKQASVYSIVEDPKYIYQHPQNDEDHHSFKERGMPEKLRQNTFDNVVLHEDKTYYKSAQQVFGKNTEVLVQDEDSRPIEVPIVPRTADKIYNRFNGENWQTKYSSEFLTCLMKNPDLNRNLALVGHLHHGKTTFMDMLVRQTHNLVSMKKENREQTMYMDSRSDESLRGISIKMKPLTLLLQDVTEKSYVITILDTPGHINFNDEVTCALRLCDGILLCVDAAEGVMLNTEKTVKQALVEKLPICLLITKIDRLITQLKMPPADAYYKIRNLIDEVNYLIDNLSFEKANIDSIEPIKGNVCFSAAYYGITFTLESFAKLFCLTKGLDLDYRQFSCKLWGEQYFIQESRCFKNKPPHSGGPKTFVQFILEPIYKIFSLIIGEEERGLNRVIKEFGLRLNRATFKLDVIPLLKEIFSRVLGNTSGLVDMIVQNIPNSRDGISIKVKNTIAGSSEANMNQTICCSIKKPFIANVLKLIPRQDYSNFGSLARIISGTLKPGDKIKVLGENFTADDEEDCSTQTVSSIDIFQTRYNIPLTCAVSGNIVLIGGLDGAVVKTATLVSNFIDHDYSIFKPLCFQNMSVMKIATEPLNPAELPKMIDGLRRINKSFPLSMTKVEESGEHTIFGTGELYLDCLMRDLREMYARIDVKVADPVVALCETIMETSCLRCFSETPNMHNKLTIISEPLDKGLAEDIETGQISLIQSKKKVGDYFQKRYNWDLLAGRRIWAFGPNTQGPNLLLDDTLPSEVDQSLLDFVKNSIIQGFQWGTKEGPLCDEPIRNVKFKLLDAQLSPEPVQRNGAQIIPTARRCCYSAFLLSTPRLMEPVYYVEILTPSDCITAIHNVMSKRRGHIASEIPKGGTPVFIVKAFIPVIESFGFETDLRYHTLGQAFCLTVFDHWSIVPGDPLNKSLNLKPLEISSLDVLSRELMVKTRRRKGLSEDVLINKFFDDPILLEIAKKDSIIC